MKPLGQSPRAEQAHNLPQVARDAASFRGGVVDFASRRVQRSRKTNWVDITNMCQLPYPINCTLGTSNYDMDVIGFYWMLLDLIGFYWILLDFIMDDDDFLDDDSLGFHHSTHDPTP